MSRIARVVIPGIPHHVTQRGNRRQRTFFCDGDYSLYLQILAKQCAEGGVGIWGYCLMPNHVHIIAVPSSKDALRSVFGEAHRYYTSHINLREKWQGHLWQGRFASYPMDEQYLLTAARYIELNPVRAGLVRQPEDYPWSSAAAHIGKKDDVLVRSAPLLERIPDWRSFLMEGVPHIELESQQITAHEHTGRPLGNDAFVRTLENMTGRNLHESRRGRKQKANLN